MIGHAAGPPRATWLMPTTAGQSFFGPASQSQPPALVTDDELVVANGDSCAAAVTCAGWRPPSRP